MVTDNKPKKVIVFEPDSYYNGQNKLTDNEILELRRVREVYLNRDFKVEVHYRVVTDYTDSLSHYISLLNEIALCDWVYFCSGVTINNKITLNIPEANYIENTLKDLLRHTKTTYEKENSINAGTGEITTTKYTFCKSYKGEEDE